MFYKNTIKLVTIISFVYCSFATLSASVIVSTFIEQYHNALPQNKALMIKAVAKQSRLKADQLLDIYHIYSTPANKSLRDAIGSKNLKVGYRMVADYISGKSKIVAQSGSITQQAQGHLKTLKERLVPLNALLDALLKFKELQNLQAEDIDDVKKVTDFINNNCKNLYDATLKFAGKTKAGEALTELEKMTKKKSATNTQSSTVDHWHQLYIAAQAAASSNPDNIEDIIKDVGVAVAAAKTGVTSQEQDILDKVAKMTGGNSDSFALKEQLLGLIRLRNQLRSILSMISDAGIKPADTKTLLTTLGWDASGGGSWKDGKVPTRGDFDAVKDAIKQEIKAMVVAVAAKAAVGGVAVAPGGAVITQEEINILKAVAKITDGNSKGLSLVEQLAHLMDLRKQLRDILITIKDAGIDGNDGTRTIKTLLTTLGWDGVNSWKDSEVPTRVDFNAVKNVIKRDIEAGVAAVKAAKAAGGITLNALKTAVGEKSKVSLEQNIQNLDKYITLPPNWQTDMTVLSKLIVDIVASYTTGMDYLAGPQGLGNAYLKRGATAALGGASILGMGVHSQHNLHYLMLSQDAISGVSLMKDGLINLKKQFVTDLNPK